MSMSSSYSPKGEHTYKLSCTLRAISDDRTTNIEQIEQKTIPLFTVKEYTATLKKLHAPITDSIEQLSQITDLNELEESHAKALKAHNDFGKQIKQAILDTPTILEQLGVNDNDPIKTEFQELSLKIDQNGDILNKYIDYIKQQKLVSNPAPESTSNEAPVEQTNRISIKYSQSANTPHDCTPADPKQKEPFKDPIRVAAEKCIFLSEAKKNCESRTKPTDDISVADTKDAKCAFDSSASTTASEQQVGPRIDPILRAARECKIRCESKIS